MGFEWYQRTSVGGRIAKEIDDVNAPGPPGGRDIFFKNEMATCCHYKGVLPPAFLKYCFGTAL